MLRTKHIPFGVNTFMRLCTCGVHQPY